jgi:protein-disulfide isomerase
MTTPRERRRSRLRTQSRIDNILTLAIVGATVLVIWVNWPKPLPPPIPLPLEPLALDATSTRGSPTAAVALIAYADFECRYCGEFARETLPAAVREYVETGKVRIVYRHVTPPNHRRAVPAAIAAECAGRQAKFWEMHDRIFAKQTDLDDASLTAHAGALGLDLAAFASCQTDRATADRVARETTEARKLRIGGTPSFFIGRVQADGRVKVTTSLRGAVPLEELQEALDQELGEGVLASIVALRHPAGLASAAVALGLVGTGLVMRRRRARRANHQVAP